MINLRFFNKKKEFVTLREVLKITNSYVLNSDIDLEKRIYNIATLSKASEHDLSFLTSPKYLSTLSASKAGFCFLEEKYTHKISANIIALLNRNPYFAYATLANHLYDDKKFPASDSTLLAKEGGYYMQSSASIGINTKIMPNVYIGHNVKIGNNCYIGSNSTIDDNCIIGDNCTINSSVVIAYSILGNNAIIHNGAKIGQDGFGFAHDQGVNHKILQLGLVVMGNDVEVGANSCIDRGAIDDTVIGNGVKMDNLVQIGHNVTIGDGTVIAGCVAIAGSANIGRFVQIGGGSRIIGHINVGDGVKIAATSGVAKEVKPMEIIGGSPAMPIRDWHRLNVKLMKLSQSSSE